MLLGGLINIDFFHLLPKPPLIYRLAALTLVISGVKIISLFLVPSWVSLPWMFATPDPRPGPAPSTGLRALLTPKDSSCFSVLPFMHI